MSFDIHFLLHIPCNKGKCIIYVLINYVQIVVWRFLQNSKGSDVLATKQALLVIVLLQYIPRLLRFIPLTSELKRTEGVFAETAWAGAVYYLLLYMLASHVSTFQVGMPLVLMIICLDFLNLPTVQNMGFIFFNSQHGRMI